MGALFLLLFLSPTIDRYIQSRISDSKADKKNDNSMESDISLTEFDKPADSEE